MKDPNCSFCNPKKTDWKESEFYGYRCGDCNQATAFVVRVDHKGQLNDDEKVVVKKLCEKHYPNLKLKWISEKRKTISHWYDFLILK